MAYMYDDDDEIKEEFPGVNRLHIIQARCGIPAVALYRAYHEQEGLCSMTGFSMSDDEGDGWYSVDIAPKVVHRKLSETNFVLVCGAVNMMRPQSMRWEQFRHFCENIADRETE